VEEEVKSGSQESQISEPKAEEQQMLTQNNSDASVQEKNQIALRATEKIGAALSQCPNLDQAQVILKEGISSVVKEAQKDVLLRVQQKMQKHSKENKVLKIGIRKMNEMIENFKLEQHSREGQVQQLQNQLMQAKNFNDNIQQQFNGQVEQTEPFQQLLRVCQAKDDYIKQQQVQINFLMKQLNGQPSSAHSQATSGNFFGDTC